ncbi:M14 family zinc carboxypeptidase [Ideonella sp. YS5]|uniref:M14 family zinc carboxypeptidase n=1 Tax=Ideonella sp. YS5 TaxID=3453714 RepID=UPI003EE8FA37
MQEPALLPPLIELDELARRAGPALRRRLLCEVHVGGRLLPVHAYLLGSTSPQAPAVAFVGGVHGLERIGAEVVIAYLRSLVMRLPWDETLQPQLRTMCFVFVPLLNPGGWWRGTRSNPQGVDLMRNAPVDALEPVPWPVGGQRLSSWLPWFRGPRGATMQAESAALCELIQAELFDRPVSIALDCHSGFGMSDRLWFPYAHTSHPIAHLAELHALNQLLDSALLHHRYIVEPQSRQYLTHGDLWDHLYLRSRQLPRPPVFLPLTLEMGSWLWVKKNPRQFFSRHGIFNPLIEHRQHRVLRRHLSLLDFVSRAVASHERWLPQDAHERDKHRQHALERWYRRSRA